jgi:hypothetical protein
LGLHTRREQVTACLSSSTAVIQMSRDIRYCSVSIKYYYNNSVVRDLPWSVYYRMFFTSHKKSPNIIHKTKYVATVQYWRRLKIPHIFDELTTFMLKLLVHLYRRLDNSTLSFLTSEIGL